MEQIAGWSGRLTRESSCGGDRRRVQLRPDLLLLDVMMPKVDGHDVCRILRQESIMRILMLTTWSDEDDLLFGLDLGADDYVTKPYSPRELMARIRTLLRRVEHSALPDDGVLRVGPLTVDTLQHEVLAPSGRPVVCTRGRVCGAGSHGRRTRPRLHPQATPRTDPGMGHLLVRTNHRHVCDAAEEEAGTGPGAGSLAEVAPVGCARHVRRHRARAGGDGVRDRLKRLADRGWLHCTPAGRFTVLPHPPA